MAGLGTKLWVAAEEVTAANMNGYLQDQVISRFASVADRTAAYGGAGEPTLTEGMFSYIDADNSFSYYDGSAWVAVGGGGTGESDQIVLGVQIFS
jgi:hypothetical protein